MLLFWIILHKNSFIRKSDFADKGGKVTLQIKAKFIWKTVNRSGESPLVHRSQGCGFITKVKVFFFGVLVLLIISFAVSISEISSKDAHVELFVAHKCVFRASFHPFVPQMRVKNTVQS